MKEILQTVLEAGKALLPAIVPGAAPVIEAAGKIAKALEAGKDLLDPGDQSEADQTIREIQAAVNAHADKTIGGLRGD